MHILGLVLAGSRGVTILEVLLTAEPALEVPVRRIVRLSLLGRFFLLQSVSDRLQLLLLLYPTSIYQLPFAERNKQIMIPDLCTRILRLFALLLGFPRLILPPRSNHPFI